MIKIICLGKLKENYLKEMVLDYTKRIRKYHKMEIIELKDEEGLDVEAKNILKHIDAKDYVITLEIKGKNLDSLELAEVIRNTFINYSTIVFVIGSSMGLSNEVSLRSNLKLSFSSLTFPHGLFRGMLLEQIYRAFKINNNENYHK
ncbi:MAG TPA: 23S rRNA (pseudouridine(1915)-N(3))-methyltransferase RlmH [Candidatus Caccenecus avistercoris]|nr:23S rRNA (pseudouridine(1915)-N(3))-methyltransferase RlmH [Candidatus Caccenecus avistercoris]